MHWRVGCLYPLLLEETSLTVDGLAGAVEAVAQSSEAIVTPDVLDVYRTLLKYVVNPKIS